MLDKVLGKLRSASGDDSISYSVEDTFFSSGSVIMIAEERSGISALDINAVTRDGDYNIQIDAAMKSGESKVDDNTEGFATFVKIRNIQPKSVKVNIFSKSSLNIITLLISLLL